MSERLTRLWINPWKYWSATAGLNQDQIDALMDRIADYSEAGNVAELSKIDFVCFENPYLCWRRERQSQFPHPRIFRWRDE